jgi:hypothetical protein
MFIWSDYQNIVHFPPPSDVPRISVYQGVCKYNISRVERGKRGEEVFDCHKPTPRPTSWHCVSRDCIHGKRSINRRNLEWPLSEYCTICNSSASRNQFISIDLFPHMNCNQCSLKKILPFQVCWAQIWTLCNFQCAFTVNTEAVAALGYSFTEINWLGPNLCMSHDWEYRYLTMGLRIS